MKKHWVLSYPLSALRRLFRLGGCPGWSESSLGTKVILLGFVMRWLNYIKGSFIVCSPLLRYFSWFRFDKKRRKEGNETLLGIKYLNGKTFKLAWSFSKDCLLSAQRSLGSLAAHTLPKNTRFDCIVCFKSLALHMPFIVVWIMFCLFSP